jgi:hypothetical protein
MLACAEARRECRLPAYPTIRRRGQEGQLWGQTRAFRLCGSSLLSLRKRRDRLEEFDSRTERKTEFAEVIFLQIAKNGLVDRLVAERCLIAFEAQAPPANSRGS